MKPPLLFRGEARAWIFVSHSSKDIQKVRLIRNCLERAGADPLIFRLKLLDNRPFGIFTLLHAEIRARQFFLQCVSANAGQSPWVKDEVAYVKTLPHKQRYEIKLDVVPWRTPIAEINAVLRHAFILIYYAWSDGPRVRQLFRTIKTQGLEDDSAAYSIFESILASGEDEYACRQSLTIDHGVRGFDDRPRKDGRTWIEVAIASVGSAHTIILCSSRSFADNPWREARLRDLEELRHKYRYCYVLDLDGQDNEADVPRWQHKSEWTFFRGSLKEQLRQLVPELRRQIGEQPESSGARRR